MALPQILAYGSKFISGGVRRLSKVSPTTWGWLIAAVVGLLFFKKIKAFIVQEIALWRVKYANDTTTKAVTVNVKEIARLAYSAIWGGWGWSEDEEAFVKAILQCPKEYITELATEYAKIDNKGKSLYNDAVAYLKDKQYNQIRHLFL